MHGSKTVNGVLIGLLAFICTSFVVKAGKPPVWHLASCELLKSVSIMGPSCTDCALAAEQRG